MVMSVIGIIFPILAILVSNFWYVLTMRALLGLALGFSSAVCPMYTSSFIDDSVKGILSSPKFPVGKVGSTYQLSVTFSILIGEFMNYLLIPSFDSEKCVPLTPFSWKMQIGFSAFFAVCLLIILFFGPNTKRTTMSVSWFVAGAKKVASSLSLSAQEFISISAFMNRSLINGETKHESLFACHVGIWVSYEV